MYVFHFNISLNTDEAGLMRSVKDLPASISTLLDCPNPSSKPSTPTHPMFGLYTEEELSLILRSEDYAWLFARTPS